ncbi:hypothetical protein CNMCM5623_009967 [Aspergillus felis]|uniref:Uncharacterized protein n=1 Tax=Aspergillus felis TaxID=1287682 RepID=A0A8H6V1K8_9EURO|nr:hypothetical protein CNMCM5623_009967 [Aspergillus felis]
MPSSWHRRVISARNATSGTTTMVVPPGVVNASTINSMLFPPPVLHPPEPHVGPPGHALRGRLQIHSGQLVPAFHAADLGLILPRGPFALA